MKPWRLHPQRLTWEYVTANGTCLACQLRYYCTRSCSDRTIHRHRDQALLEKARKIAKSKAAKRDLKRRQHLMGRSFADATNSHGFKRARWRGRWRQAIQDLLIATVQNLRKLIRHLSQRRPELAPDLPGLLRSLLSLFLDRPLLLFAS
jgi:Transposase DDE domain